MPFRKAARAGRGANDTIFPSARPPRSIAPSTLRGGVAICPWLCVALLGRAVDAKAGEPPSRAAAAAIFVDAGGPAEGRPDAPVDAGVASDPEARADALIDAGLDDAAKPLARPETDVGSRPGH